MSKSHLFLKNEFGVCLMFNHTRGRDSNEETLEDGKDYRQQRENFHRCRMDFEQALKNRHSSRTKNISVEHFDVLSIDFLKIADSTLVEQYCRVYGLSELSYSNMNQTVLFAISDEERFNEVFMTQIDSFVAKGNNAGTEYKPLTLMAGFHYWSSDSMKSFGITDGDAHDVLLELVESSPKIVSKHRIVVEAMEGYLNRKRITYKKIESGIYQLDFIPKEELEFLLDNFDVIQKIQSLYTTRVQPNNFGEPERVSDATLNLLEGAPTIGVIDTGVQRLAVLNPILERDGFDLVDKDTPHPYEIDLRSDSSHGTTVATLAAFGNNFYRNINANVVDADAKIFSIKVQSGETGLVNIADIKEAIIAAHRNYGIRIFNLSMSVRGKFYNEDISTYAYILDELAYSYDLLIFISVGNLSVDDIECMQIVASDSKTSDKVKRFLKYPNHYYNPFVTLEETECHDGECMNLCEPSESMNNMSVGAIAESYNPNHGNYGLSLGREFPAYYSRKYYMDYNSLINGTRFKNNQKNKNLFKPDIVMPGGDQLDIESRMIVLAPRLDGAGLKIEQNSGTSYATPLAANIAAKITRKYPNLNMQSVKALIINSAEPINKHYLDDTVNDLKSLDNNSYPNVDSNEKAILSKRYSEERLSKYISGHGVPNISKCIDSDDNRCTFVIEETIAFDSHKVVNLNIPNYLLQYSKKDAVLTLTATLCYKFNPKRTDVLSYCPIHIAFNFGNSMNRDEPKKNAEEYASRRASDNKDRMAIKSNVGSWSDDFYPVSSKIFSNVQRMSLNISRDEIEKVHNQISIIFRCTCRENFEGTNHPFSFVLTIEQKHSEELVGNSLYDSLEQINRVEAIAQASLEAEL